MSIENITILSPSSSYTMLSAIMVSGTVSGTDIARIEIENPVTEQGIITAVPIDVEGALTWATPVGVEVTEGTNIITVTAFDVLDQSLSSDIVIDFRAISIVPLSPDPLVTQTVLTVNVTGEITGANDGEITTVKITNDQGTATTVNATVTYDNINDKYTWTASVVLINGKLNTLTIAATNSANEILQQTFALQAWAATITVTAPVLLPIKYTSNPTIPVSGKITGAVLSAAPTLAITNIQNEHSLMATVTTGADYSWAVADLQLVNGTNTVTIVATNNAGGIITATFELIIADYIKPNASSFPNNNATNVSTTEQIKVMFDKVMAPATVIGALSISPTATGTWQTTDNQEFVFQHSVPFKGIKQQTTLNPYSATLVPTTYTVTLAGTAKDYLSLTPVNQQYQSVNNLAAPFSFSFTAGSYKGKLFESEKLSSAQVFDYIPPVIVNTFRYKQYKGKLYVENDAALLSFGSEFEYIPIKLVNTFRYKEHRGVLYKSLIDKHHIEQVTVDMLKINRLHLFDSPNSTYRVRTTSPEIKWINPQTAKPRLHYRVLLSQSPYFHNSLIFDTKHNHEAFAISEDGKNFEPITQYGIAPVGFTRFQCPIKLIEGTWYLRLLVVNKEENL